MEFIDRFKGKKVGFDTSIFIYYIEEHPKYFHLLNDAFEYNNKAFFQIITSPITLIEVLIHPYRKKEFELARKYEEIITGSPRIEVINIDFGIAKLSAELRANHNLRIPDAIQIATAIQQNRDYFLTNDRRLKAAHKIEVLVLEDLILP